MIPPEQENSSRHEYSFSRGEFVVSYPPVRHWGRFQVESMISEVPAAHNAGPINIYIHIPFCYRKCSFCYYMTVEPMKKTDRDLFIQSLCREIRKACKLFDLGARPVRSVYIGGGTPTLLTLKQLDKLISCITSSFSLEQCEFTIEAEPLSLTEVKVRNLLGHGINRISIGIQSFNDTVLRNCRRNYDARAALESIDRVRSAGECIINLDLLSGLPGETTDTWDSTIRQTLSTDVQHLTIYRMIRYSNTDVAYRRERFDSFSIPTDAEEIQFMDHALSVLEETEYVPWSYYSFSKNGRYKHVHSSAIWTGEDLYGFGPSAFSIMGTWQFQNTNNINSFINRLEQDQLPYYRGYRMRERDLQIRAVLLGMKLLSIDEIDLQERLGVNFACLDRKTVDWLENNKFICFSSSKIGLTRKGMLYGDSVGKILARAM